MKNSLATLANLPLFSPVFYDDIEVFSSSIGVNDQESELDQTSILLAILNRASQVINSTCLYPDDLHRSVLDTIIWLLPADLVRLSLLDENSSLVNEYSNCNDGQPHQVSRYPLAGSFVEHVLNSEGTLCCADFNRTMKETYSTESSIYSWKHISGLAVKIQHGSRHLGVLSIQKSQPGVYTATDQLILESFAAHVSIALENAHLHARLRRAAVSEERKRFARDLHDTVTQMLYSIVLLSSGWKVKARENRLENPESAFETLENRGLRILKEMRLLIHQLRPAILHEQGLVKAIQHRLESVEQRVNIKVKLLLSDEFPSLPEKQEEELFNICMEALNNALRHAEASAITVQLNHQPDRVILRISDNGVGFGMASISTGIGFISMQERAEAIGARLLVRSKPLQGTVISVSSPIDAPEGF